MFGPERSARAPSEAAAAGGLEPDFVAGEAGVARQGGPPPAGRPVEDPAKRAADAVEARRRPLTEKACYEEYLALAGTDAPELARQAEAVLRGGGEDCQKVAMLRALYATDPDRSRVLDHFVQAIFTQPDRPRPEGVSVPAFAVDFLGKRVADPMVRGIVERIAWTGYLAVSPELRRQAAASLLATASPADQQRYAAFPDYQAQVAALAAASEVAR